ncbi:hypothetical protein EDB89DRAFT_1911942 [Lactarius sanguifluus]|nr:hypothetical protein EDB89DRAFT_1911942 [Lactarius sanguifluus]
MVDRHRFVVAVASSKASLSLSSPCLAIAGGGIVASARGLAQPAGWSLCVAALTGELLLPHDKQTPAGASDGSTTAISEVTTHRRRQQGRPNRMTTTRRQWPATTMAHNDNGPRPTLTVAATAMWTLVHDGSRGQQRCGSRLGIY